jgi:hypothetical protein
MAKRLELTRGYFALVDDGAFEELSAKRWYALICKYGKVYAARREGPAKKRVVVLMHRLLLGAAKGEEVDHINGNGLDNRLENLRIATSRQNKFNQGIRSSNSSGYKGVSWHQKDGKWRSRINIAGKSKWLGNFSCPIEAARAYDAAARVEAGEFAVCNFQGELSSLNSQAAGSSRR